MATRAAAWFRNRIETAGLSGSDRAEYAAMLTRTGDCAQAIRIRRELAREAPDNLAAQGNLGVTLATCGGSRAEAQQIAGALAQIRRPYVHGAQHLQRAAILASLGDREGAMSALQMAFAEGTYWSGATFHLSSAFDSLRNYPPFVELMKPKG